MQQNSPLPPASRQGAVVILVSFAVFIAAILISLVAMARSDRPTHETITEPAGFEHIHGLGVDPADGALYVASHFGVFRVTDGKPQRVADRYQDTMGFAVIGPRHFLASGHPDLREDLPASLGLIESTDGAKTWQSLSLIGEADLHSIEPTESTIYAIDAAGGRLIATDDRREWRVIDSRPLVDLAASEDSGELVATTPEGELLLYATGQGPTQMGAAPQLAYVDWSGETLVGAATNGDIYVSASGESWRKVGAIDSDAAALEVNSETWYAATQDSVLASTDSGRTWKSVAP